MAVDRPNDEAGHAVRDGVENGRRRHIVRSDLRAYLASKRAPSFLDPPDGAVAVPGQQARSDVNGAGLLYVSLPAYRELGRAPADVNVQHHGVTGFPGEGRRARAVRRKQAFEMRAGGGADKLAGVGRE